MRKLFRTISRRLLSLTTNNPSPEATLSVAQWVTVVGGPLQGYELLLDLKSSEPWQREMFEGRFDTFTYEALRDLGNLEGATIWDVGAHIGYHSLCFAVLVGERGQVVAFEPNPVNLDRVQQNLARNEALAPRARALPLALSNRDGESQFIYSRSIENGRSSGSHLVNARAPEDQSVYKAFEEMTISIARADTMISRGSLPKPSFVKMDVEGAELEVLEGMVELLHTTQPTLVIEIHRIATMYYVQQFLTKLDFQLRLINEQNSRKQICHVLATPTQRKQLGIEPRTV